MIEKLLTAVFSRCVSDGSLTVGMASGAKRSFGNGAAPHVAVRFADAAAERLVLLNPQLYVGELFMDGRLIVERGTIYDFLAIVLGGMVGQPRTLPERLLDQIRFMKRRSISDNRPWRSRRNVAHHYDLDCRLYRLFLDPDLQYSCAYFEFPGQSLEEAQLAKKRLITAKLLVEPDSRVLDIGSGWGGLGLYVKQIGGAAGVLGVTLSTEQLELARKRAAEAGFADSVRFALEDYRNVKGSFDRIVSVGMFEHVGPRYYEAYFRKCRELLEPDGVVVIHTIGLLDGPWYPNAWLDKYIFPGGQLPALSEIVPAVERAGLVVTDVECLRLHYAQTLAAWRARFMANRDEARALYDERFCRMWEFYLAACEAAFRFQNVAVFQIQCARRQDAVPLTRDYIRERMYELRAREGQAHAALEPTPEMAPLRKQRH
jgi:cyclopropane-fatty-acyl-phospholipid synthase